MRTILVVSLLIGLARSQEETEPRHNASYVPDDDETVRGLMAQAIAEATNDDPDKAAEALQSLLRSSGGGVLPVRGRELFVSPRRWAALALLAEQPPFSAKVLAAWRRRHNDGANAALRATIEAGDETAVLRVLREYPAATAAPAALFALCDRALQRGDIERAHGYLLRAPEHVAHSQLKAWLAAPAYAARKKHLAALPDRPPAGWPTLGGDAGRARHGDAIPEPKTLRRLWTVPFLDEVPATFEQRSLFSLRKHSPILPFYPVFDEKHLYLHLGQRIVVLRRADGRFLFFAPEAREAKIFAVDAMIAYTPGMRAATVSDGIVYFNRMLITGSSKCQRHNILTAFDVARRQVLWQAGRAMNRREPILKKLVFFRGAPAVVGDKLYVYGAVREESEGKPSRKEEAYLFCFHKKTGALLWHRFLGYGDTEAAPSLPPQSGLAPAVKHGVVVAVTGLGVAGGLDADTGEILWLFRYNRKPARERERLTEIQEVQAHPGDGWLREPPKISGDVAICAPIDCDGSYGFWLRGRRDPTNGRFYLQLWFRKRTHSPDENSLGEQVAGIARGRVHYVGRRDPNHLTASYQTVVSHPRDDGETGYAFGRIPALERDAETGRRVPPEIFGRATIAGGALYVPTRFTLFRFDVKKPLETRMDKDRRIVEIPYLHPAYFPVAEPTPEHSPKRPLFGTLVAVGGRLYAVTADRVICYGAK